MAGAEALRIGGWTLSSFDTGRFRLDGGAMFGVVPKTLWDRTNPADDRNRIELALRGLLLEGHGRRLLVDPGIGDKWSAKLTDLYGIDHSRFNLSKALAARGLGPQDITDVIVSHLHFDHVGGSTTRDGAGGIRLTFPNATYYVHRKNLDHAHAPTPRDRASFIEENIEPLRASGKLKLVDDGFEFAPGVTARVTHGHTPGQLLPLVGGPEGKLIFCGDTIPTTSHVPIPYVMAYDLQPLVTMEEKRSLLHQAVEENWVLFYVHDPKVAATRVVREGERYQAGEEVSLR